MQIINNGANPQEPEQSLASARQNLLEAFIERNAAIDRLVRVMSQTYQEGAKDPGSPAPLEPEDPGNSTDDDGFSDVRYCW